MRLWTLSRLPSVRGVPLWGWLSCTKPLRVWALAGFHPHVYGRGGLRAPLTRRRQAKLPLSDLSGRHVGYHKSLLIRVLINTGSLLLINVCIPVMLTLSSRDCGPFMLEILTILSSDCDPPR